MTIYMLLYTLFSCAALYGLWMFISRTKRVAKKKEEAKIEVQESRETKGGLKIETLIYGSGKEAKKGSELTVHYEGWLENGAKVDSSHDRGQPFTFKLGRGDVIYGWDEGLKGMQLGEKRRLTIPPKFAYGTKGTDTVPPKATMIFEIDLLGLK